MLTNLKRILLTQYIGAIITAYIAVQGILLLIGVVFLLITSVFWPQTQSVVSSRFVPEWGRVLHDTIRAVLHLAVAAGFVRWLYFAPRPAMVEPDTDASDKDKSGDGEEMEA